jgi:hypothetical protein
LIEMTRAAEIGSLDPRIRSKVAVELESSWPIPTRVGPALELRFFYYARYGPPPAEYDDLYPPSWWAAISAETGKVLRVTKGRPSEFGIAGPPDKPFARHAFPTEWTPAAVATMKEQMLHLLDDIVAAWVQGDNRREVATMKAHFAKLFVPLAAPPLIVCYRSVSRPFYDWVGIQ